MKVTIEYTLPEEREEMEHAIKGHDYMAVLASLDNQLRSIVKYGNNLSEDSKVTYQAARDLLHKAAEGRGVELI